MPGCTVTVPEASTAPMPWSRVTAAACREDQTRVQGSPGSTAAGLAERSTVAGTHACTVTVAVSVPSPPLPSATASVTS